MDRRALVAESDMAERLHFLLSTESFLRAMLIFTMIPGGQICCYPHFTGEEVEA